MLLVDGAANIFNRGGAIARLNSSASLLSAFTATQDEWQAFRLYTQRISTTLGGPFDTDLWQKLVIQISYEDAAVRNSIFSLGNFFRHRPDQGNSHISACSCTPCVQALKSYNKAIALVVEKSARIADPSSLNAALASCALFICIESYRMNDRNAIALIQSGCGMLSESLRRSQDLRTRDVEPEFLNLFTRLRVLSAAFGQVVQWPRLLPDSTPKGIHEPLYDRLDYARSSLYDIMTAALCLRRHSAEVLIPMWPLTTSSRTIEDVAHERDVVVSRLRIWDANFMGLKEALQSEPPESSLAARMLYAHFLQTMIYAETSLELSQDCYDRYFSDFQQVAEAAETSLHQLSPGDPTARFSFEHCFLGILYLCALKCRRPSMRKRLIGLMRLCRGKEGLWHRGESLTVASRVMELEEGHSEFIPTSDNQAVTLTGGPPRFHDVLCAVNCVTDGKTVVHVTYVAHLKDSEPKWLAMKETLVVDK